MNMVEVITYGGGAFYRDTFQAVAMLSGTNGLSSMIRLGLMVGLIMGLIGAVFDFNIGKILKWFLVAFITMGILFVPKVQVHVTDVFDPSLTGADVANVPLGVGMTVSLASRVGHRAIELTETAFGDPDAAEYSKTGMIYGAKVFERLRTARIADPRFEANLHSFVRGCVYYDILDGHYSSGELARQNDLWNYITVTKGTNPGRSIEYVNPASREIVSCTVAAQRLNGEWAATLNSSARLFQRRLRPEIDESQLQAAFQNELGSLHPYMLGASRDATSTFQQVLMANAIRRGVTGFSAEAGGDAVAVMAETQAEMQTRNTQQLLGGIADKAIPILKIVVDLLFIGMFPILFPAFLLPGIGPKMIKGYLTGFLYLQLWGPMYVIVHKISMGTAAAKTTAAAYIPDTVPGIKIANLEAIGSVNADIAGVAGVMTMMIPVLAGMLTKGAMAVGGQGEALLSQFRSGAEAAGAAATTGNFSFGNTAFENASWNNMSANRHVTSAEVDQGNYRQVDGNLNRLEIGSNGNRTFTASQSQMAVSGRLSEGISSAATEAATQRLEESKNISNAWSQAQTRTATEAAERMNSWANATSSTFSTGEDDRRTFGQMYQWADTTSQSLQKTYGLTETQARNATARAAIEVFGGGSVGSPKILPVRGEVGTKVSASGELSTSKSDAETVGLQAARNAASSSTFQDSVNNARQTFASQVYAQSSTATSMSSEKVSDTFASSNSVTQAVQRAETESRILEQRADYSRTNGVTMDYNLNNELYQFAMNRLEGQRDVHGAIIDQEAAHAIISGQRSDSALHMSTIQDEFIRQKATTISEPELLTANRDVGANVRNLDLPELRTIETPASGAELRDGFGLANLGPAGGRISNAAPGSSEWSEERAAAVAARHSSNSSGEGRAHDRAARDGVHEDIPTGPGGTPVLQPGFYGADRENIRQQALSGGNLIDLHGSPDGKLFGENHQQSTGSSRIARRNQ